VKGAGRKGAFVSERAGQIRCYITVTLPRAPVRRKKCFADVCIRRAMMANRRRENSPVRMCGWLRSGQKRNGLYCAARRWCFADEISANRYTGTFKLNGPDTMAVAGTGKAEVTQPGAAIGGRGQADDVHLSCEQADEWVVVAGAAIKPGNRREAQRGGVLRRAQIRRRCRSSQTSWRTKVSSQDMFGALRGTGHDG